MKFKKGHILLAALVTILSLVGFTHLRNQSVVKASNEDSASYSLEKISETAAEAVFHLKVENPQQGSKITLAIAEETAQILYAEDIEEYLSLEDGSKTSTQKMDIVDSGDKNKVTVTFNESNETYVIPIVLKADSLNKSIHGLLKVISKEAEVASDSFNLSYVEVEEAQSDDTEVPEIVPFAAPEARIASVVTDWAGFIAALNDTNVDVINLGNDIPRGSGAAPGTLSRNLTINGNGHKLDFGANNGNLTLGNVAGTLTLNDLTITKLGSTGIFTSGTSTSAVWTVNFTNVVTPEGNIAPTITSQRATINLMGENKFYSTNDTMTVLNVYTDNGAKSLIASNDTGGASVAWALGINDGNRGGGTVTVDNATLELYGKTVSGIRLRYGGNKFVVSNNATLKAVTDTSTGNAATVRFSSSGDGNEFYISDNSVFDIQHYGGSAPALRLNGNNFITEVTGASKMNIYNKGSGSASNTTNEALNLPGNNNTYKIRDRGSRVYMIADSGPSIYGSAGSSTIDAGPETEYIARGTTAGANYGTFNMGATASVLADNPYYYDFANTRSGGGNIFSLSGSAGKFVAQNTDVSVWSKGSRVYIDNPVYDWTLIDFTLTGSNLATISSSSDSGFSSLFGAPNNYSRMSGNNARPIVDDLRIPTNGDKKIYGHASVPEGFESIRDAWSDEVDVDVVVKNADGSIAYNLTGSSIGAPGIEVYGEASRNGMFEIELPDGKYLETGQTVEVTGARRSGANSSAGKLHESLPEDIQTSVVTTIDVTPPSKAVTSTDLNNATKQITGTSDEDGAKVFVKVNGQWLKDTSNNLVTTTVSGGQWTIDLQGYLAEGDKVDVYLKDILDGQSILVNNTNLQEVAAEEGITDLTTIPDIKAYFGDKFYALPVTYTQEPDGVYGNISEEVDGYSSYVGYHDAIDFSSTGGIDKRFSSATRLTAKDIIPDAPSLIKGSASSGGSTTSIGDEVTYTLTAKNNKADSVDWKGVVLEDVLEPGLDFDSADHGITIKQIDASGTETNVPLAADTFDYNETTRLLSFKLGDIPTKYSYVVTFKVTIGNDATVDQDIMNKATAKGYSPQESLDPFVPGPITGPFKVIDTTSNEVGLPGGTLYGILQLTSAPAVIDFKTHAATMNDTRVETPELSDPLTVSDSRGNRKSWTLTAQLTGALANTEDTTKVLADAIKFNNGTTEDALTGAATVIKTHTHTGAGEYVVSDEWTSGGTGIKLVVPAGSVAKLGEYRAEITWVLGDTPTP